MRYLIEVTVRVQNGDDAFTATRTVKGETYDSVSISEREYALTKTVSDLRGSLLEEIKKANR